MAVPRPAPRKVTIEDRIALWLTAYNAVLDEIAVPYDGVPDVTPSDRRAAAAIAAELVKGVTDAHDANPR